MVHPPEQNLFFSLQFRLCFHELVLCPVLSDLVFLIYSNEIAKTFAVTPSFSLAQVQGPFNDINDLLSKNPKLQKTSPEACLTASPSI